MSDPNLYVRFYLVSNERRVFLRERSNKLYSVFSYFMAKLISELPVQIIGNILFGVIIYFTVDFNDTSYRKYLIYLGILQLGAIAGTFYAYFLGSISNRKETLISSFPVSDFNIVI